MESESADPRPPSILPHRFRLKGKRAEEMLEELARETFFTDWCFPNPRLPSGKEVCDLLVIFESTALIWQIKNLRVRADERYNPGEVAKNLKQLGGARRSLLDLKIPIKVENPRRGKEVFDPSIVKEAFLLSVLAGPGEAFYTPSATVAGHVAHIFSGAALERTLDEQHTFAPRSSSTYQRSAL